MSQVKFGKPTPAALKFIADNMRKADADEVWASGRYTPTEAIELSVRGSKKLVVVYADDTPLTVLGVVPRGVLSDVGIPWLLSAEQALNYKREFLKLSPPVIDEMLDIYPKLVNHVHSKNKLSIRWLKWLGFTIEDPELIRTTGELFHRFHMER